MRLSEAILLGLAVMKPAAYQLAIGEHACALGAAYIALGWMDKSGAWNNTRKLCAESVPLITFLKRNDFHDIPCGCARPDDPADVLYWHCPRGVIAHIFNEHVMGDKTWTLEQLADYVRSIEPPEVEVAEKEPASIPSEVATSCADRG